MTKDLIQENLQELFSAYAMDFNGDRLEIHRPNYIAIEIKAITSINKSFRVTEIHTKAIWLTIWNSSLITHLWIKK